MVWNCHQYFCRQPPLCILGLTVILSAGCSDPVVTVVERIEYHSPETPISGEKADDEFHAESVPAFDPDRSHPQVQNDRTVNLSSTVTKLDVSVLKPDVDQDLLKLHANFQDAMASVKSMGMTILPSVNVIDTKSRHFDAGLTAALEEHWFSGNSEPLQGDLGFLKRLATTLPPDSRAAAYFAAGLELAGIPIPATNEAAKKVFTNRYTSEVSLSEPAGIYLWNESLKQCYRINHFFQMEFDLDDNDWMQPVVQALQTDSSLAEDYRQIMNRWSRLSNTPSRLTILDLVNSSGVVELVRLRRERNITSSAVSLFPPRFHREAVLGRKLFPLGYSVEDDVLDAIARSIRQGQIDLRPTQTSGWHDYQSYALETVLAPQRGEESHSLLLSARYKRRRFELVQATITKSQEIQSRQGDFMASTPVEPATDTNRFPPRLRLEPAPTYYLRMARAYRFLDTTLRELIAEPQLSQLHGLTAAGKRSLPLIQELKELQRLFYGCYVLSTEDLGMKLNVEESELSDVAECRRVAQGWLDQAGNDPDLALDARTLCTVADDNRRQITSALATLGVRICRLQASYIPAAPPRVKGAESNEWLPLETTQLGESTYLMPVDEVTSVKIRSDHVLTDREFQKLCDELVEREKILRRLQL